MCKRARIFKHNGEKVIITNNWSTYTYLNVLLRTNRGDIIIRRVHNNKSDDKIIDLPITILKHDYTLRHCTTDCIGR